MLSQEFATFTFIFKVEDIDFTFNVKEKTREEALKRLRSLMAIIINEINEDIKENYGKTSSK